MDWVDNKISAFHTHRVVEVPANLPEVSSDLPVVSSDVISSLEEEERRLEEQMQQAEERYAMFLWSIFDETLHLSTGTLTIL